MNAAVRISASASRRCPGGAETGRAACRSRHDTGAGRAASRWPDGADGARAASRRPWRVVPALIELRIAVITFSILYVSFYFSIVRTTAGRRVFPA